LDPFLKILAGNLFNTYGRDIQDICIVFPGRRAGLFFRKYLSGICGKTLLCPQIFSISEFFQQFTRLRQSDPVDMVFELYHIYSGLIKEPESFDEFYHWGEIMISDFDDIDKYCIDPDALFRNIIDLREIDTIFDYLSPEQKEVLERFWGFFRKEKLSTQKESFLKIWKVLLPCYHGLKEKLRTDQLAWEGMIYRDVAESLISGNHIQTPWKKVIFAGFNALNNAEKAVFRYFLRSGTAEYYWDYDQYYTGNEVMEAGRFMRDNLREFPPPELADQFRNLGKQEIIIYELPSDLAQAKYLHKLLGKVDPDNPEEFHDTAVVLGNEQLLVPVLSSLPEDIADVNVTMGYQLSITPVYSFIDKILQMQKKLGRQTGRRTDRF